MTDGPDPEELRTAETLAAEFVHKHGIREATHYEAFISALHGITDEEHRVVAAYLRLARQGLPVPVPDCYRKYENKPHVDERFWEIVQAFGMCDTAERAGFVLSLANRLNRHHQEGETNV